MVINAIAPDFHEPSGKDMQGEPVECAGPMVFLLSDDASFITGADLPIDGGYLALGSEGLGETAVIAGSK